MPFKLRRRLEQRQGQQRLGGGAAPGLPPPAPSGAAAVSGGLVPLPAGTSAAGELVALGEGGSGSSGSSMGSAVEELLPSRPGSPSWDGPGNKPLNSVERTIRMRQIELSVRLRAQERQQLARQQVQQQQVQQQLQQQQQVQQQQARLARQQPQQRAQAQPQLRQRLQQQALEPAAAALPGQHGMPRRRKSSAARALAQRPAYLLQASARWPQHLPRLRAAVPCPQERRTADAARSTGNRCTQSPGPPAADGCMHAFAGPWPPALQLAVRGRGRRQARHPAAAAGGLPLPGCGPAAGAAPVACRGQARGGGGCAGGARAAHQARALGAC
jgi:hypothetical protein